MASPKLPEVGRPRVYMYMYNYDMRHNKCFTI